MKNEGKKGEPGLNPFAPSSLLATVIHAAGIATASATAINAAAAAAAALLPIDSAIERGAHSTESKNSITKLSWTGKE